VDAVRFEVRGEVELSTRLREFRERMPLELAAALYQEAEIEMTEAKERTPVDTGALRSSGYVTPPSISGTRVTVELGFGGSAAPYAIYVHEDLDAFHTTGQAKYLESVLMESAPFIGERVAARLTRSAA
jgi:hypothetical protein